MEPADISRLMGMTRMSAVVVQERCLRVLQALLLRLALLAYVEHRDDAVEFRQKAM